MKIVFFTGAGISAESGVPTFRDSDGLWEGHRPEEVASISEWNSHYNRKAKRETILRFYNEMRKSLSKVEPNKAHYDIAKLQESHEVYIITQNVDDLHERAGSLNVLHLHGSLLESKSTYDSSLVYECTGDINIGDKCERGSQLRPNVVWFGEDVPLLIEAYDIIKDADAIIAVGTSGVVEPAASLFRGVNGNEKFKGIVNPIIPIDEYSNMNLDTIVKIEKPATIGVEEIINELLK